MKAVIYPFRREDAIMGLARDFPQLAWAVVTSPEELAHEIADAEILVTSNRVCTPAYGEALRRNARKWTCAFLIPKSTHRWTASLMFGRPGKERSSFPARRLSR